MICGLKIRVHGDEEMKVRDICAGIADGSHNPPQGIEISDYLMLSSKIFLMMRSRLMIQDI